MLRLSVVLLPSLEKPLHAEEGATAALSSPAEGAETRKSTFTFQGMRFQEEQLTASEAAAAARAVPGDLESAGGLVVISDAELDTIRSDDALLGERASEHVKGDSSAGEEPVATLPQRGPQQRADGGADASLLVPPPRALLPVERLVDVEFCVATPAVREVWLPTRSSQADPLFSEELLWSDLGSPNHPDSSPFLHVYALSGCGPGAMLSHEMAEALGLMAMRMLRHQLRCLLKQLSALEVASPLGRSTGDWEEEDGAPAMGLALQEVLRRCCPPPSAGGVSVTWDTELVTAVASTVAVGQHTAPSPLPLGGANGRRAGQRRRQGGEAEATEPPEVARDSDGMEAWSDAVGSGSDSDGMGRRRPHHSNAQCPFNDSDTEGRAIWRSRRQAEHEERQRRETSEAPRATAPHAVSQASPPPAAVVAPLTLRHVPLRRTAFSLRLSRALSPSAAHSDPARTESEVAVEVEEEEAPLDEVRTDDHIRIRFMAESVAVVQESKADALAATAYVAEMLKRFVGPAECHAKSGTTLFQSARKSVEGTDEVRRERSQTLREALSEYVTAAQCAQRGLLYPFDDVPRRPPLEAMWEEPRGGYNDAVKRRMLAADTSRDHVYALLEGLSTPHGFSAEQEHKASEARSRFCQGLLSPMVIPGETYYNETILRVHCHRHFPPPWMGKEGEQPSLTAARLATQWRRRGRPSSPFALPPPTGSQLCMYALVRLVVTTTANAALVAVTLFEQPPQGQPQATIREMEAFAAPCEKASALVLSLLRWHEPFPSPLTERGGSESDADTDDCATDAGDVKHHETAWCFGMYCKLKLRGARLFSLAGRGDVSQRWRRELGETLDRWERHRGRRCCGPSREDSQDPSSVWAAASTSPEAMVCRVSAEDWSTLSAEVRRELQLRHH